MSLCQKNCIYISYNSSNNMAKCSCPIQTENTTIDSYFFQFSRNELINIFYMTLSHSNFKVMKCYRLLFSKKGQINNYGSLILISIITINIILMILCFISGKKKIKFFIEIVIRQKLGNINKKRKRTSKPNEMVKKKRKKTIKTIIHKQGINNEGFNSSILKLDKILERKKEPPRKKYKIGKIFTSVDKNSKEDRTLSSKHIFKKSNSNIFSLSPNKSRIKLDSNLENKIQNKKSFSYKNKDKNLRLSKISNTLNNKNINNIKNEILNNNSKLTDLELNNLDFEKAKEMDKRGFIQIYWSILKLNHFILFAFIPNEDYNLRTIKISLLLISFSLYFTNNCFFFSDNSMHKIYIELGQFIFINQLPQMVYSTLISSTINALLKFISLSGKNILAIKKVPNYEYVLKKATAVEKCEKRKIILFYAISFTFLLFFWYFISCFCAVYLNTQKILVSDTLISFAISMIYPFGVYLIPSILRLIALKQDNENQAYKICLYKLSLLLS